VGITTPTWKAGMRSPPSLSFGNTPRNSGKPSSTWPSFAAASSLVGFALAAQSPCWGFLFGEVGWGKRKDPAAAHAFPPSLFC
jgi:hypothetical protein